MMENIALTDPLMAISYELHQFVTNLQQPRLADRKWAEAVCLRCRELSERVAAARESITVHQKVLYRSLEGIAGNLRAYAQELEESPNIIRLREMYQSLAQGYELLRVELITSNKQRSAGKVFRLRRLKTINYTRNVFHMIMGLAGVLLYEYVLSYRQASIIMVGLSVTFLFLELSRRFLPQWNDFMVDRLFGAISRPWERHQMNSATYYALSLALVTLFFPKPVVQTAVLVLAFGDPVATLSGKRWGKRVLFNEKTYVGVAAFILASFAMTLMFLFLVAEGLTVGSKFTLAFTVSLAGAFVELFSESIDDNLTIPLFCACIAYFWFAA